MIKDNQNSSPRKKNNAPSLHAFKKAIDDSFISKMPPIALFKEIDRAMNGGLVYKETKAPVPTKSVKLTKEFLESATGKIFKTVIVSCFKNYADTFTKEQKEIGDKQMAVYYKLVMKCRDNNGSKRALTALNKINTKETRQALFQTLMFKARICNLWKHEMKYNLKNVSRLSEHNKAVYELFKVWFKEATGLEPDNANIEMYLCIQESSLGMSALSLLAIGMFIPLAALYSRGLKAVEIEHRNPATPK